MSASPKDFAHALYAMRPAPSAAMPARKKPKMTPVKKKLPHSGKPKAKPRAI